MSNAPELESSLALESKAKHLAAIDVEATAGRLNPDSRAEITSPVERDIRNHEVDSQPPLPDSMPTNYQDVAEALVATSWSAIMTLVYLATRETSVVPQLSIVGAVLTFVSSLAIMCIKSEFPSIEQILGHLMLFSAVTTCVVFLMIIFPLVAVFPFYIIIIVLYSWFVAAKRFSYGAATNIPPAST